CALILHFWCRGLSQAVDSFLVTLLIPLAGHRRFRVPTIPFSERVGLLCLVVNDALSSPICVDVQVLRAVTGFYNVAVDFESFDQH
ncbi:12635_t:CDS:2, partial [Ambispora gerdemannii]